MKRSFLFKIIMIICMSAANTLLAHESNAHDAGSKYQMGQPQQSQTNLHRSATDKKAAMQAHENYHQRTIKQQFGQHRQHIQESERNQRQLQQHMQQDVRALRRPGRLNSKSTPNPERDARLSRLRDLYRHDTAHGLHRRDGDSQYNRPPYRATLNQYSAAAPYQFNQLGQTNAWQGARWQRFNRQFRDNGVHAFQSPMRGVRNQPGQSIQTRTKSKSSHQMGAMAGRLILSKRNTQKRQDLEVQKQFSKEAPSALSPQDAQN